MNYRIRQLKREIKKRGGCVIISEKIPDDALEAFLKEVLSCPCCAQPDRRTERSTHGFVGQPETKSNPRGEH
jgi:hypothetical protein